MILQKQLQAAGSKLSTLEWSLQLDQSRQRIWWISILENRAAGARQVEEMVTFTELYLPDLKTVVGRDCYTSRSRFWALQRIPKQTLPRKEGF